MRRGDKGVSSRLTENWFIPMGVLTRYMELLRAGPESLGSFCLFPFGERKHQPLSFLPIIDSKKLSPKVALAHEGGK